MAREVRIRGIDYLQRMEQAQSDNQGVHIDVRDWNLTRSFQALAVDFRPTAAFGTSTNNAPVYGAAIMGNIINATAITPTDNMLAGIIAKNDITADPSTTYPHAALIAEVGDGSTADYAVLAVLGGDAAATTPVAMFGVDRWSSVVASQPTYGLDLAGPAAHDGYGAMIYSTADIRFSSGGLLATFTTAITANTTTTSLAAGTLAKTTNATGRASLFVSDGTKWQFLTNS